MAATPTDPRETAPTAIAPIATDARHPLIGAQPRPQLTFYGAYHSNKVNVGIHMIFVPTIMW